MNNIEKNILLLKRQHSLVFLSSLSGFSLVSILLSLQIVPLKTLLTTNLFYTLPIASMVFVPLIFFYVVYIIKSDLLNRFMPFYIVCIDILFFPVGVLADHFSLCYYPLWYIDSLAFLAVYYYTQKTRNHWTTYFVGALLILSFVLSKTPAIVRYLNTIMSNYGIGTLQNQNSSFFQIMLSPLSILQLLTLLAGFLYLAYSLHIVSEINFYRSVIVATDSNDENKFLLIEEQKSKSLYADILRYFRKHSPYKNPHFNITNLAIALNTNSRYISVVLNLNKSMGFRQFVNQYRVYEVKKMIQENEQKNYTLKYIYSSCGFQNQSTFNKVFKAIEGVTPSEYFKNKESMEKLE